MKQNISQHITSSLHTDTHLCFFAFLMGSFRLPCTIYSCHTPQTAQRFSHQDQVLLNLFSLLKLVRLSVLYLQHGETNTTFCSRTEQEHYFTFKCIFFQMKVLYIYSMNNYSSTPHGCIRAHSCSRLAMNNSTVSF